MVAELLERLRAALADRYAIQRELGQGGMATVYLAEDLKHHRKVAVKVLRPELAAALGPDRFTREIEVAAQLQHPHILPLHDSGESDGFLYYVMPYVEGESLRDRLAHHGELPVHEAVKLLCEIVDALAYAHGRGVVHRDIKPDNIMLSGRHALVMDFGVAKAVSEATGRNMLTTAGVALGTPAYMAPEQAAADPHLDHRVDIYALGAMAYELLTGRPPFTGLTPQQVLAAHVTESPEMVTRFRPTISPTLAQVVMKCLAKRPADRWQSAEELFGQLEPLVTPSAGMTPVETRPVAAVARPSPLPRWNLMAAGVLLALGAGGFLLWRHRPAPLALGKRAAVTLDPGLEQNPTVSGDGRFVAYIRLTGNENRLYVQQLGAGAPIAVTPPSVEVLPVPPAWSPDGTRILFTSDRGLELVPPLGGAQRLIVPLAADLPFGWGTWSPDGHRIAYALGDSVYVTDVEAPAPRALFGGGQPHSLNWSPDGAWIAFVSGNWQYGPFANLAPSSIWVVRTADGHAVRVTPDQPLNASPTWLPGGRGLLFVSTRDGGRDVYQVLLSRSGEPDGPPVRLTTGLNAHTISLSADGHRLVYAVSTEAANVHALTLQPGRTVSLSAARPLTSGSQITEGFSVSRDQHWLVFDSDRSGNQDIWRMPLDRSGPPEQLTTTPEDEFQPGISPDGRWIAFHRTRSGQVRDLYLMPAAGGIPTRLAVATDNNLAPRWSPDQRHLLYICPTPATYRVCVASLGPDGKTVLATRTVFAQSATIAGGGGNGSAWSPDGKTIGVWENGVLLLPFPDGPPRRLTTDSSGFFSYFVRWPADGGTIYINGTRPDRSYSILAVRVADGSTRQVVVSEGPTSQSFRFSFEVQGNTVYLSLADRQSDIWMAEMEKQ